METEEQRSRFLTTVRQEIKRFFDLTVSTLGLVILAPLFGLISIAVKLDSTGPVFFKQARPGKNGKIFTLYKFRTMKELWDERGIPLPDEERLTRTGKTLRRLSLDELSQLINILKGDMSLVGPRPLFIQYLDLYTPEQARRHEVKPGMTGWAQVSGRNAITWEEKFKYDVWYVDNWSIWIDLKILFLTVWKVLRGEGISQEGRATVEHFRGTKISGSK